MFDTILNVLLVIISIALIILCLLQSGKSDGIVNALTGQSSNLFAQQKDRGADLVMTRVTTGLAIASSLLPLLLECHNNRTIGPIFIFV